MDPLDNSDRDGPSDNDPAVSGHKVVHQTAISSRKRVHRRASDSDYGEEQSQARVECISNRDHRDKSDEDSDDGIAEEGGEDEPERMEVDKPDENGDVSEEDGGKSATWIPTPELIMEWMERELSRRPPDHVRGPVWPRDAPPGFVFDLAGSGVVPADLVTRGEGGGTGFRGSVAEYPTDVVATVAARPLSSRVSNTRPVKSTFTSATQKIWKSTLRRSSLW